MNEVGVNIPIYGSIIILYFFIMLLIGWIAKNKTKTIDDYWVAGRKLGILVLFGTFFGTFLSGYSYMGLAGGAYKLGFSMWLLGNGTWIGPLIILFTVKYFVKFAGHTISDIFEARYGPVARPVSAIIIGWGALIFVGINIYVIGLALFQVFGLSLNITVLLIGIVIVIYTVLGGFYAVAWTDCIQSLIMIGGMTVAVFVVLANVGGFAALIDSATKVDPRLVAPVGPNQTPMALFALALAFGLGNPSQPMYLVRAFSAKNTQSIRLGIGFATIVTLWAMFGGVIVGMGGRILFPDVTPVDIIFPHVVTILLHPILGALVIGAMVSAVMSSADSALLLVGTAVAKDFYARYFNPDADQKQLIRVSKISVLVGGIIAVLFALWHPSIVIIMGAYVFGAMAAALFIPLYVGFFWIRPTQVAAVASMIAGLSGIVIFTVNPVPILHPIIMGVLSSLVTYLLFTFITPSDPKRVEAFMERIGRS